MKHVTQIFSRKALSIICALAIVLSCVSVGFSALAETPSAAAQYVVDADKSPAIPMFAGTKIDLNNVSVLFKGDEAATAGADITWTLGGDYGQNLILGDDNSLTALLKGNEYKITATAGEKEAVLWVVVANKGDSAWNLYSIDFDAIAEANNYAGLTFVRGEDATAKNASGNNSTYSTGEFKYTDESGTVTVDSTNVPENLKFPTDWTAYTWALVNGPSSGDPEIQKIPFVMPYSHTVEGNTSDSYVTRGENVTSGIMPFDNPYKANLLGVGIDANTNVANSLGLGDSHVRGYFVLNNEITQAFMDYKINANMDVAIATLLYTTGTSRVGMFGRLRMNETTGKPKTTMDYTFHASKAPNASGGIANKEIGNVYVWTSAFYNANNWYDTFQDYKVSHVYFDVMLKNQMHPYAAIPGGVTMTGYGVNYSFRGGVSVPGGMDEANGVPYIRWDYLLDKKFNENNQINIRTNLQLSLTYEGDTATMSSPLSSTAITFDNVYTDKGAVGVCIGSIDEDNQYMNVHQFSIDLVNDINAVNDGSEYPVYYKHYYQPVVDATAEDGAVNAEKNEITFTTISAAIDYLEGNGGKVWVKGDFSVDTSALEGTITPRKAITIAGYGDVATAASITITSGEYNAWMKGDITFDDITFSQNGASSWVGLHSNGYVLTYGDGVVTSGNEWFATEGNTNDQNLVIKGGTFHSFYTRSGNISYQTNLKSNTNILLDGGYIKSVFTGTKTNFSRSMNFIGDFNLTVKSGKIDNFYFYGHAYRTLSAYAGDSIITVNGGIVSKIRFGGSEKRAYTEKGLTVTTGNLVAIVDESKLTSGCEVLVHDTKTHYNPASGKKWMAIFNNAGANNYATWGDNASSLDYRIETYSGKTTPVFEREEGKPETSTLVGFTIESNENSAKVLPLINGQKIAPIEGKTTADGKAIYDLSAYEDTLITISFADERIPVVSTDESFTPDVNVYKKVASMSDAIAMLGANGGTVYVQGTYNFSEFANESNRVSYPTIFAGTANITNGSLAIKGYTDANTNGTDNTLFFLRGVWDGALADNAFKCDVLFDDITLAGSDIGEAGFSILGHTLTLGENLVMAEGASIRISKHLGKSSSIVDANIVINGGKYSHVSSFDGNVDGGVTHNRNYNITLNGGTIDNIYVLGNTNFKDGMKTLNGDINYTINGGTINGYLSVSGTAQGCKNTIVNGNVTFRVNGGYIKKYIDFAYGVISTENYKTENVSLNGNFAAIVNCETLTNGLIFTGADSFKNINLADYSKAMFIVNNYDKYYKNVNTDTASINEATGAAYFDYNLKVFGGAAEPVYNADRSLKGFAITPAAGNEDKLLVVNGTDIIEAVGGVYDLSDFEDIGWAEIEFKAADELEDTQEVVTDSSVIAGYINGVVPVKEGYLFGGFIGEDGKALKADEIANAESLTVKFIPKAVLDIGWQIRQNGNTVDLRLISTVDSLEYSAVTFIVKVAGRDDMVLTSKKVYTSIAGYKDGENVQYAPTAFSAASEYFMTHVITGIPAGFHGTDFTVTANLLTKDGKTITGDAIEFQIKDHADYTAIVE